MGDITQGIDGFFFIIDDAHLWGFDPFNKVRL